MGLAVTFFAAALTVYGVIDTNLARILLVLGGLVLVGGIVTSDYLRDKSPKHIGAVAIIAISVIGGSLFGLDRWAVSKKLQQEARAAPSLASQPQSSPSAPSPVTSPTTMQAKPKPPRKHKPPPAPQITANGKDSGAVGTLNQGPGSIAQIGGQNNTAIIGSVPPPARKLSVENASRLASAVTAHTATILILYAQQDEEAYEVAKQIGDVLSVAGWTLKQPVTGTTRMREGGGPLFGMLLGWNGERTLAGSPVHLDSNTAWGSLGLELWRDFPEEFYVQPSPNTDDLIVLYVYANPKSKPAP